MAARKSSRVNCKYKTKYRIRNWREYERGLRSRGYVTIRISEEAVAAWTPSKNSLRGGQRRYSKPSELDRVDAAGCFPPPASPDRGLHRSGRGAQHPADQGTVLDQALVSRDSKPSVKIWSFPTGARQAGFEEATDWTWALILLGALTGSTP